MELIVSYLITHLQRREYAKASSEDTRLTSLEVSHAIRYNHVSRGGNFTKLMPMRI